ncbi:hypothetical protein GGTG_10616 [Gaeumannomyces tritici R3-111a-1]|uniref:Major facilitator superfamily (MFS) profile domain-containing protein n=1 Tax=Gaeumannomyces tritici (strain R3-111a-1) TaxID=644352 RepID=J3PAU1_GAET3|nr:hypothetical protein GGTG_10616 [Gaeumannomyces tritici R3-111a-1]EJT71357.1 hypothetical protein GGTG_10616 [Gaeumannomyces tritici R3-111a-1]
MTGYKLTALATGITLALFLSALDTTIISTSLVSMTNDLGGFDQRNWVATAYLLTYTGFLVVLSKFSDILGRKSIVLASIAIFTIFSIACGSVSSILALIINRSFQGIGASGMYAMGNVIAPEIVPPEQWGNYTSIMPLVMVLSSVLGPILGGFMNDYLSWRWVFFLKCVHVLFYHSFRESFLTKPYGLCSGPFGVVIFAMVALAMPTNFPNHGSMLARPEEALHARVASSRRSLARLDLIGAFLFLAFSILLVFGFEQGGRRFPWQSAVIIASITLGAVLFLAFIVWERFAGASQGSTREPIFPLRLMKHRRFVGMILVGFLTGVPFMTILINTPQRFQAVNGLSAWNAGLRTLSLLLSSAVGTLISSQLVAKAKIPPSYVLFAGVALQVLGVGLASTVGPDDMPHLYGYEVLMGVSFGVTPAMLVVLVPYTVERDDLAVCMGAVTQVRVLGGTIGLAICSTVLNNYLKVHLLSVLDQTQLRGISHSIAAIDQLPKSLQTTVRGIFSDGFNTR